MLKQEILGTIHPWLLSIAKNPDTAKIKPLDRSFCDSYKNRGKKLQKIHWHSVAGKTVVIQGLLLNQEFALGLRAAFVLQSSLV